MSELVYILKNGSGGAASAGFLLEKTSIATKAFASSISLLDEFDATPAGCVVADADPEGGNLLAGFRRRKVGVPVILVSRNADVESAVRALRDGAFDYLETPIRRQQFFDSVGQALGLCTSAHNGDPTWSDTQSRLERLTVREHQVLDLVVHGNTNRVIAAELELSPKTVEIHRSRVMRKMQAPSLADLVGTVRCFQCTRWPGPVN